MPLQSGTQTQAPLWHVSLLAQLPHEPPHASGPHFFVPHCGLHAHWPPLQPVPAGQVPHSPPQPSEPQLLPAQAGVQIDAQAPVVVLQNCPAAQVPHEPPQPSGPQLLPTQLGVQAALHCPLTQAWPEQVPHVPPQPSLPQTLPVQSGVQPAAHVPAEQCCDEGQLPHELPQPSSPHDLPAQEPLHVSVHWVPSRLQNWSPQQIAQYWPQPSGPQTLPVQSGVHPLPASGVPPSTPGGLFCATAPLWLPPHPAAISATSNAAPRIRTTYQQYAGPSGLPIQGQRFQR